MGGRNFLIDIFHSFNGLIEIVVVAAGKNSSDLF